jgi:SAM-dependent methyltransferase
VNIGYRFQAGEARQPYNPPRWSVFGCDDCGLIFVNPRPTWEELSDYHQPTFQCYNAIDQNEDHLLEEALHSGQFRHIPVPVGKRLLDVGCGGGSFLRIFKQMGVAEVKGVEPSEAAAAAGRACGTDIFTGTLEEYVEQEGCDHKYDVITCSHVLGSTPQPVETLSAMQKLLAPNGYIAIFVPNYACAAAQELSWRWHSFDLPYNLIQYTSKNLAIAGERAGLMVRRHYTYSLPEAVAYSICLQRRHRWATPHSITRKFLSEKYVRQIAADLDSRGEGEAIMMEFCHPFA